MNLSLQDFYSQLRLKHPDQLRTAPGSTDEIILVLIDDQSILGIPELYQGNRRIYAQTLNQINKGNPRAIALDVFFGSESTNALNQDQLLTKAVANGKTIVRAYRRDDKRMTPPFAQLARAARAHPTYFRPYYGESIRTVSLAFYSESRETMPSMQTMLALLYNGADESMVNYSSSKIELPTEPTSQIPLISGEFMLINYDVPIRSFKSVSFYDVYRGNIPSEAFADKIVFIGSANSMTEEKYHIPAGTTEFAPYLNAMAMRTILYDKAIKPSSAFQGLLTAIVLLLVSLFLFLRFQNPLFSFIFTFLISVSLLGSSFYLYVFRNISIDVVEPLFAVIFTLGFTLGQKYYMELSEKMRIKGAFQHYVTASVVNEILKDPDKLNLHGEERNLSIFFSDIEGFTSLSEGMSPLEVVKLLNEYLTAMTEIIFNFNGLLDKYEGDAIMSVFGAPISQKDHATRACRCALENQKTLRKLREKWKKEGRPEIRVRIGINTGNVVVGNMGSTMRFDYTVIGDNVNLASRLETANKLFKTEILVSSTTAKAAEDIIISRCLGMLKAAGKTRPVEVFELMASTEDDSSEFVKDCLARKESYEKAHQHFSTQCFNEATKLLTEHLEKWPDDKPASLLLSRSKGYQLVPPPPDWLDIIVQDHT